MCVAARAPCLWSDSAGPNHSFQTAGEVRTKNQPGLGKPAPAPAPPLYVPQKPLCTYQTLHLNSFRAPMLAEGPPCSDTCSFIHC